MRTLLSGGDPGVYLGAVIESVCGRFGIVNVNALNGHVVELPAALAVDYGNESKDQRIALREQRWTPVGTSRRFFGADMTDAVVFEGGCLCGAVRYRAASSPIRGVICHCSMCRRHSGAPVLAFVHFRVEDFAWVRGEPTRYRSSEFAQRGFCATCGSTLSMHEEVLADRVQIAVGSLDEPQRVRIDDHVWTQHQLPWFQVDDRLPRFPTSSTAAPSNAAGGGR